MCNCELLDACDNNDLEKIKTLIQNGYDIHDYDEYILRMSCYKNYFDIFIFAIENGANIYDYSNFILKTAIYESHLNIIKYIYSIGIDVFIESELIKLKFNENQIEEIKLSKISRRTPLLYLLN